MKHSSLFMAATALLTLSQMAFATDMVIYHDCKNQDGSMSYRIYPCDKGQSEVRKFDVDLDELASLESRKSTIDAAKSGRINNGKQQSQDTVGTERVTNIAAPPTYSDSKHTVPCEVKEYTELRDMPVSSLMREYCTYSRLRDIHRSAKNCIECLEAGIVCSGQLLKVMNIMQNRNILPNC